MSGMADSGNKGEDNTLEGDECWDDPSLCGLYDDDVSGES